MFINNDDLELMIKMENLIGSNTELLFTDNNYLEITHDDFISYWNLIERLINKKIKRNERQAEVNREKRKIDKNYGRKKNNEKML